MQRRINRKRASRIKTFHVQKNLQWSKGIYHIILLETSMPSDNQNKWVVTAHEWKIHETISSILLFIQDILGRFQWKLPQWEVKLVYQIHLTSNGRLFIQLLRLTQATSLHLYTQMCSRMKTRTRKLKKCMQIPFSKQEMMEHNKFKSFINKQLIRRKIL